MQTTFCWAFSCCVHMKLFSRYLTHAISKTTFGRNINFQSDLVCVLCLQASKNLKHSDCLDRISVIVEMAFLWYFCLDSVHIFLNCYRLPLAIMYGSKYLMQPSDCRRLYVISKIPCIHYVSVRGKVLCPPSTSISSLTD